MRIAASACISHSRLGGSWLKSCIGRECGYEPRGPLKETTSWMVDKGNSISHSLPIAPASQLRVAKDYMHARLPLLFSLKRMASQSSTDGKPADGTCSIGRRLSLKTSQGANAMVVPQPSGAAEKKGGLWLDFGSELFAPEGMVHQPMFVSHMSLLGESYLLVHVLGQFMSSQCLSSCPLQNT